MRYFSLILVTLFTLTLSASADDSTGTFYQWTDSSGIVSVTDDPEAIPPAYRDSVQVRTWEELRAKTEHHLTPADTASQVFFSGPPASRSTPAPACEGPRTVRRIRVQEGDRNFPVFLTFDGCGRLLSSTRTNPDVLLIEP
jgi:hypothetical protein